MLLEFFQLLVSELGKESGRSLKRNLIGSKSPPLSGVQQKEGRKSIHPSLDSNGSFVAVSFDVVLIFFPTCPELYMQ